MTDDTPKKTLSLPQGERSKPATRRAPVRSSSIATPRIKPAAPAAEDKKAARPPRAEQERTPRRPTADERPRRSGESSPPSRAPRSGADPAERSFKPRPATRPAAEGTRDAERRPPRRSDETPRPRPARPAERFADAPAREERAPRIPYAERDVPHERRSRGADGVTKAPGFGKAGAARRAAPAAEPKDAQGAVRLSKRMTELGMCSRREADEYIERGWVTVDGVVVDELGSKILPDQKIELTRQAEATQNLRMTVILNKPVGYVSGQAEDGYEPASVLITAENHWEEDPIKRRFETRHMKKLAPAGRLDIDSTGMLVLTQDGRIAKQLIGENSDIEKEYLVRVEGPLSYDNLALLNHGLVLDGVELQPAKVSWQNEHQLRFVLREGRKRQIRRMCELVGLTVTALKRIRIGSIPLSKLPPGKWRYLGDHEKF
ncbi:pseudouridine synthase [Uliginosibacterium sediminicola]|uniref:Dual-specificity RNA pseudouridine synthase RluF n=1 Tax=Uliginosibacterium sediminicola TaxID=2024550 RepID=A0ABU9YWD4_9RHOO